MKNTKNIQRQTKKYEGQSILVIEQITTWLCSQSNIHQESQVYWFRFSTKLHNLTLISFNSKLNPMIKTLKKNMLLMHIDPRLFTNNKT